MQAIELSVRDYNNIRKNKKQIGSGVDGSAYVINKDTIYKFYHKLNNNITLPNATLDSEGVIINDFKSLRPYNKVIQNENIYYTDNEGVILTREEAIYKAIEKQRNVKLTDLPKNIIYVSNKIVGCEYKYYPHRFGIYASVYLPLNIRLKICKRIIEKVKELLDNNIYPVTLAQRDSMYPFKSNGSNILIGLDLEPLIIDLDGISAMYSDSYSSKYYNKVLSTLSSLVLELLLKVKLADNIEDDDYVVNEYCSLMEEAGITNILSKKFFDNNYLELDEIENVIKSLELRKK